MNPVFAPLNIARPFEAAQQRWTIRSKPRDRIRTDYLTARISRTRRRTTTMPERTRAGQKFQRPISSRQQKRPCFQGPF
jgi:hypothetical protein